MPSRSFCGDMARLKLLPENAVTGSPSMSAVMTLTVPDLLATCADARNKHSESSSHQSPPLSRKYARHSEWGGAGGGSGSSGGSGGARGGVRAPAPQAVQWAETVAGCLPVSLLLRTQLPHSASAVWQQDRAAGA